MNKKNLFNLLNNVKEEGKETVEGKRVLIIDGLNLFFRNFAVLNMVNPQGSHIGGLGGFFRSLGFLIKTMDPYEVYVVFDGLDSSKSRKNLISEYKSGRDTMRVNTFVFDDRDEENDSKIDQIVRITHYLKTLPVKTIIIDKVEADDVIAFLSTNLPKKPKDKIFIVSSDQDFLQLINSNVTVYRPIEKEFYTKESVKDKFNVYPENFLIYKTLMGDTSDKLKGVKGLGPKKLFKLFPTLTSKKTTLEDICSICESNIKDHIIYPKILKTITELEKSHKVMDLSKPMLSLQDEDYLNEIIKNKKLNYDPEQFLQFYKKDQLGNIINNVDLWIKTTFEKIKNK